MSNYMTRRRRPPSQNWKTFLRNHAEAIAAIDRWVVPTVTFERPFAFLVIGHNRRRKCVERWRALLALLTFVKWPSATAIESINS